MLEKGDRVHITRLGVSGRIDTIWTPEEGRTLYKIELDQNYKRAHWYVASEDELEEEE